LVIGAVVGLASELASGLSNVEEIVEDIKVEQL